MYGGFYFGSPTFFYPLPQNVLKPTKKIGPFKKKKIIQKYKPRSIFFWAKSQRKKSWPNQKNPAYGRHQISQPMRTEDTITKKVQIKNNINPEGLLVF